MDFPIRINKYLAEERIASRREADRLIEAGKILVNGVPAVIGQKVFAEDTVELIGKAPKHTYIAYYKPRGIIAHSPGAHEEDIVSCLKRTHGISGVYPIGRLDKDSEGLILLSDDGRIVKGLLDPDAHKEKEYEVTVDKHVSETALKKMEIGVSIEGYMTKPATTKKVSDKRFILTLTEGKKHQIRRMCAALGYQVQSLKRLRIMNITLGELSSGEFRNLSSHEVDHLLNELL